MGVSANWNDRLREAAKMSGLQQKELASRSGVAASSLSRLLSADDVDVQASTLERIAKALNIRVGDLFDSEAPLRVEKNPYSATPEYRTLLDLLETLPAPERRRIVEHTTWIADRFSRSNSGKTVTAGNEPANATPSELKLTIVKEEQGEKESGHYDFPVPKGKFVERDYDYPRAFHYFEKPMAPPHAAGSQGAGIVDFPQGTARILHSIRDVRNELLQVIKIYGDSMAPVLGDGFKVLVDTTLTKPENGAIVAVYIHEEGGLVGYWERDGDQVIIAKENGAYQPVKLGPPSEWILWGTVISIVEAPLPSARKRRKR